VAPRIGFDVSVPVVYEFIHVDLQATIGSEYLGRARATSAVADYTNGYMSDTTVLIVDAPDVHGVNYNFKLMPTVYLRRLIIGCGADFSGYHEKSDVGVMYTIDKRTNDTLVARTGHYFYGGGGQFQPCAKIGVKFRRVGFFLYKEANTIGIQIGFSIVERKCPWVLRTSVTSE
jgi:hypothetical protein